MQYFRKFYLIFSFASTCSPDRDVQKPRLPQPALVESNTAKKLEQKPLSQEKKLVAETVLQEVETVFQENNKSLPHEAKTLPQPEKEQEKNTQIIVLPTVPSISNDPVKYHGNGILVGLPNKQQKNCWINSSLQVLYALYKDKILNLPDASPLKKIIQVMEKSIENRQEVVTQDEFDAFITELSNEPNLKYRIIISESHTQTLNLNGKGNSYTFFNAVNNVYNFIEKLTLHYTSCWHPDPYDFEMYRFMKILDKTLFQESIKDKFWTNYIAGDITRLPDPFIVEYSMGTQVIADLLSIQQMHSSFFYQDRSQLKFPKDPNETTYSKSSSETIAKTTSSETVAEATSSESSSETVANQAEFIPINLTLEACIVNRPSHVYSYIKKSNRWYCANDRSITEVSESVMVQDLCNKSLICFYKKN